VVTASHGAWSRVRPTLDERVAARALGMALEPAAPPNLVADTLIRVARGDRGAVERALWRVRARVADHPSAIAVQAADILRVALDRLPTATEGAGGEHAHE